MRWHFWRKRTEQSTDEVGGRSARFEYRFERLERNMEAQLAMIDERTRILADALSTELRALGRIMADLSRNMTELNEKLANGDRSDPLAFGVALEPKPERRRIFDDGPLETELAAVLAPPTPANDAPMPLRRDIDPMLLDALTKGRVAFETEIVGAIPHRTPLLAIVRFAPPLPLIDSSAVDQLAELFPDAALLLDRLIMDAAASMIRAGQIPAHLPLLVPLSPASARDGAQVADFRRRFDRVGHAGGIIPLLSEAGWIALVEAGEDRMKELAGDRGGFAIRASGERRLDQAALAGLKVRYVMTSAALLAATGQNLLAPDIHPADVARLFARFGIGLIAEDVTDQVRVLGLLRNNITMGCGSAMQPDSEPAPAAETQPSGSESRDYRAHLRRAGS